MTQVTLKRSLELNVGDRIVGTTDEEPRRVKKIMWISDHRLDIYAEDGIVFPNTHSLTLWRIA